MVSFHSCGILEKRPSKAPWDKSEDHRLDRRWSPSTIISSKHMGTVLKGGVWSGGHTCQGRCCPGQGSHIVNLSELPFPPEHGGD